MLRLVMGVSVDKKGNDGRQRILRPQCTGKFGEQLESSVLRNVLEGSGEAEEQISNPSEEVLVLCTKRGSKGRDDTRNSLEMLVLGDI